MRTVNDEQSKKCQKISHRTRTVYLDIAVGAECQPDGMTFEKVEREMEQLGGK
jgi:hypothetical protein